MEEAIRELDYLVVWKRNTVMAGVMGNFFRVETIGGQLTRDEA